jgi:hypothetical protein
MFLGQLLHATGRRMNAQQQVIERKAFADRNDNLPIQHKLPRPEPFHALNNLREIAAQRLSGL